MASGEARRKREQVILCPFNISADPEIMTYQNMSLARSVWTGRYGTGLPSSIQPITVLKLIHVCLTVTRRRVYAVAGGTGMSHLKVLEDSK